MSGTFGAQDAQLGQGGVRPGQAPPRTVAHVGVEAQCRQHGDGHPGCGRREVMKRGLRTLCSGRLQGSWRRAACRMMRAELGGRPRGQGMASWRGAAPGEETEWRLEERGREVGALRGLPACKPKCTSVWSAGGTGGQGEAGGVQGRGSRGCRGACLCAALAPGLWLNR